MKIRRLFGKGEITEDKPDNTGLVTVDIRINQKDRSQRTVKTVVVEQDTGETVYKATYSDKQSQTDYGAYLKAEEATRLFCRNMDYIIADMIENTEKPVVRTVSKRAR